MGAVVVPDEEDPEPGDAGPPALPVPGRHAARAGASVPVVGVPRVLAVPDGLRGRVAVGPAQVAVLAVVAAVALAVLAWWVLASRPTEVAAPRAATTEVAGTPMAPAEGAAATAPAGTASGGAGTADPTAPGTTGAATGELVVHVAGRVARPGIVVLPVGSRVADAVEAAGGAPPDVDLTGVNLARLLVDGEQVLVGVEGVPAPTGAQPGGGAAGGAGGAPGAPGAGGLVNLNTADEAALDTLPGVGPVTAQAIVEWRASNGGFTSVDELVEVDGIGEATLARLAPLVTV
ncbi:ComEA family DNA-binding protein [Nocardioides sp. ChNu-153]|nr:ComEA family DNA-binding protein [Nocardioides sp. ChNu-153]